MKFHLAVSVAFTFLLLALLAFFQGADAGDGILLFLGRFHPVLLHVPIGALLALFLLECLHWARPKLNLGSACTIVLWFSALSVLPAVAAGFWLAGSGGYNDELLGLHKWLGWGTALLCIWLLVLRTRIEKGSGSSLFYRFCLLVNVILLSLAGHYGGSLTHGSDYLTKHMPLYLKAKLGVELSESEQLIAAIQAETPEERMEEAMTFVNHVQPLMDQYCYGCHGADKQKGNIRLDLLNWDMIGGPDAEGWHTALDQINAGEMPPKGKAQLKDEERRLLVDWMTESLAIAADAKRGENKAVLRRLTKAQYSNTLNELLKLSNDFGNSLPDDGKSEMGFSNNGEILQISPLHIDYYQKIAREALDKAIIFDEKPEPLRYKVTFGEAIGKDSLGGSFGGFQSVAVEPDDFRVDILSADGSIKRGETKEEKALLSQVKKNIGVGLRGSSGDRYAIVSEGMMLYSALPHVNKPPESWQGPSPNMKMIIKNDYPREGGDFVMRVEASKGYHWETREGVIGLRGEAKPAKQTEESIILKAADAEKLKNMQLKDGQWLMPKKLTGYAKAFLKLQIPKDDFYQLDLVHPYASSDAMPAYRIRIAKFNRSEKRLKLKDDQALEKQITTPVTMAYLKAGEYPVEVGGKFFVGMSELIVTPLDGDAPIRDELAKEAQRNREKYATELPAIRVFAGARTDDGMDFQNFDLPKVVSAKTGEFETYEFKGRLENLPLPVYNPNAKGPFANMMNLGLWNDHLVKDKGDSGPPLLVKSIELEAPYYDAWPPESHTSIFIDSSKSSDKDVYTREIIENFTERAFRREVSAAEVDRYMKFWAGIKDGYDRYEDSVKEVLVAVLCSPHFLYLVDSEESEEEVADDDFHLASRLSYFLWNTAPDNALMASAKSGNLKKELLKHVRRMVQDPRISEMIRSFAYEWLRIDRQQATKVDVDVDQYQDYSRFVKEDMPKETYEFIHHVLKENLSVLNFIDSDFAMLNQNLAEFYGIKGVKGNGFRTVPIKAEQNRGGLLSQGAFLTGHSDGVQAHPIKRAVWLKEKILGNPPPPAPPNVPEIDPDTPGFEKMTLKEQLELHRNKASCIDCHEKIDPFGIVFENYDAVGRFQETAKGKPIDSKVTLPDGAEVDGIRGIKEYIINEKSREFTRSLIEHLFAYALGRDVSYADEKEISAIVEEVSSDGYRFQTVVEQIVFSPSFTGEYQ